MRQVVGRWIRLSCVAGIAAAALGAGPVAALTLERAVAAALAHNERTRAAELTAQAAGARVAQARSFLLPSLTASGEAIREAATLAEVAGGDATHSTEGRLVVTQAIFAPQALPLLAQARALGRAARLDALDVRQRLAYDAAAAYLRLLTDLQISRAADERLGLAHRNLSEVQVRFGAELVGSNDVTRAELEAASAERELVRAQGAARVARLRLEYVMGIPVEDSLIAPTRLLEAASQADAPGTLSPVPRADLLAREARLSALRAAAREPLLRYLPALGFEGTGRSVREEGSASVEDWSLGLGLTWRLFDGGVREHQRSERRALARAAELELANFERGVRVEIEAARTALESERASLARARVAVDVARRNLAETTELYRQGLVRALEVVDANVQLFDAEVERAGAESALALAYLSLRIALGLEPVEMEAQP